MSSEKPVEIQMAAINNDETKVTEEHQISTTNYVVESNLNIVLKKLKQFAYNKNLRTLIIFLFFSELGFAYQDNVGYVEMLEHGLD